MELRKKIFLVFAALAVSLMLMPAGAALADTVLYKGPPAKYVFFFIGDGLGQPQRAATEWYLADLKGEQAGGAPLTMTKFPAQGITTTHAANRFITGSAAAGTALASGYKTNINYISVLPDFTPVKTMAEMAKEQGMKVGVISTVSIDHATPAAFYAHQPTRKMYHEIAHDLVKSGFDYFGGGGFLDPSGKKSKKPLGDAIEAAKASGYKIVQDKAAFQKLDKDSGKVIAINSWLQDDKAMPYYIDRGRKDISLAEFTEKGIELLDNPNGFFMMIEGGKIDWACHANDAMAAIGDVLDFDEAVRLAHKFYQQHPRETLIVVTGDHECGGMSLGFAGTQYDTDFSSLHGQKISFMAFEEKVKEFHREKTPFDEAMKAVTKDFGLKVSELKDYELDSLKAVYVRSLQGERENVEGLDYVVYGGYDPFTVTITHVLNQRAGIAWTSYSHTGVPVPTSAEGVGAAIFNGYYDNTDVAWKIMSVMGCQAYIKTVAR